MPQSAVSPPHKQFLRPSTLERFLRIACFSPILYSQPLTTFDHSFRKHTLHSSRSSSSSFSSSSPPSKHFLVTFVKFHSINGFSELTHQNVKSQSLCKSLRFFAAAKDALSLPHGLLRCFSGPFHLQLRGCLFVSRIFCRGMG